MFRPFTTACAQSRTKMICTAILTTLAMVATACSSSGTRSGSGQKQGKASVGSAFPVVHDDWAKVGYRLDWVGFPFPNAGEGAKVPFIQPLGDVVIAQLRDSTVAALEVATGKTRWSNTPASTLTRFVGITGLPQEQASVLVSSESEVFRLSLATGDLVGRERFHRVVNTSPLLQGGLAIYGTSVGEVMAHLLGRGVKAWGFATVGSIDFAPVRVGDAVAAVSQAGDVMFLSADGSLLGRARVYGPLATNPVSDNGILYIAGTDQSIWAFDPSGATLWRHRTSVPLRNQPAVFGGRLYIDIAGSGLTAFDAITGKVLWAAPSVTGTVIGSQKGRLLAWSTGTLTILDPERGDIMAQIKVPGVVGVVTDRTEDGNLYAVSDRALIAKFIPR